MEKASSPTTQHRRALGITFALTFIYFVIEVVGGILTNSLALLADAAHIRQHVGGLALALMLRNDPNSLLSLRSDDPILHKLETYRLHRLGFPTTDIAEVFGFARTYLYTMWRQFEADGTIALVKKNWGAACRKRTTELEAAIIRAKALNPGRSDEDLAEEFDLDRITVYRLLKEHGIQDLHRGVDSQAATASGESKMSLQKSVRKRKQQNET